jgi:hypothetical protein
VAAVPNCFLKINPLTVVLAKPSITSGLGLADVGVLVFVLGALFVVGVCVVGLLFVVICWFVCGNARTVLFFVVCK